MTTLNQLADEVLMNLTSFGVIQPKVSSLSGSVTDTATSIALTSVSGVVPGQAEIGEELVYVTAVDGSTSTATVIRGYLSTTAAAHASGTVFVSNVVWPRAMVLNALNDAIEASYPSLFSVGTDAVAADSLLTTYLLDPDVEDVREVKVLDRNGTGENFSYSAWRFDRQRKELSVHVTLFGGETINVVTVKRPTRIASTDALTVSGLQASAKKYAVAQACADLIVNMDNQRLQVNYASADDIDANRPSGSAIALAKTLLGRAQMELNNERRRLVQTYPTTIHTAKGRF